MTVSLQSTLYHAVLMARNPMLPTVLRMHCPLSAQCSATIDGACSNCGELKVVSCNAGGHFI
jgi:hypothetical protein